MKFQRVIAVLLACLLAGCQAAQVAPRGYPAAVAPHREPAMAIETCDPEPRRELPNSVQPVAYMPSVTFLPEPEPVDVPAAPTQGGELTLEQLEEIALANNPTLRLAQSQIEKERGAWTQVGLYPNPVAGYLRSDPDQPTQSRTHGAFLQQTFVTAGKLRLAREEESFGLQDTIHGLDAQRHRVLNDVRARYYDTLGAQYTLDVARRLERIAVEGLDVAQRAEKALQINRLDVVRSEMQLKRIQLAVRSAQDQYAAAWQHLTDMMGTPDLSPAPLVGDLEDDIPDLDEEQQWQRLRDESPLLQQLYAQTGIARKGWELAQAQRVPDITGQVVVERDSTQRFTNVQTLLALPLPIFNRNQGGIHTAYHELRRAETEIERTELALRDAFTVSYRQYASACNQVQTLKNDLLPGAQESLDLTIRGYERGEFPLADVLDARQVYFETQLDYAAALTELRVAAIEVEGMQLTGGLNPAEIGTAIQGAEGAATQRRAVQQLLQQQDRGQLKKFTPGTTGE
jgi:cobalt-zinc-cadmium efflux system outer membrane protein